MATLPDISSLGPRPVPDAARPMAQISQGAVTAVGDAAARLGNTTATIGFEMLDREATAAAKERDAAISDQIRAMLYDPQTGYMNQQGGNAVQAREMVIKRLEEMKGPAMEGLNKAAQRKLKDALDARIDRAMMSIDTHASGERKTWINGASAARIESAYQDSLFNPAETNLAIKTITDELRATSVREGWSPEEYKLASSKATSKVFNDQAMRIASSDPVAAMQYLRENQDKMLPVDVVNLEAKLQPAVKEYVGWQRGRELFNSVSAPAKASFKALEDSLGFPLKINSGYRDPQHNAAVGGAKHSQHIEGNAFDVDVSGMSIEQRKAVIVAARKAGFAGIGVYNNALHFDVAGDRAWGPSYGRESLPEWAAEVVASPIGNRPSMWDEVLAEDDPLIRESMSKSIEAHQSIRSGQVKAEKEAAEQAVMAVIEAGGDLDGDVSLEERTALGRDAMASLRAYQNAKNAGQTIETNPVAYLELRQLQANNPGAFKAVDMLTYKDKLSETDWQGFVDAQNKPRDSVTSVAASTLMTTAQRQMQAAGIDTTPKEGTDESLKVAEVQTQLLQWQDQYIKDKGQTPSQIEIDRQVARMLTPVVINPSGPMNEQTIKAFELGGLDISEGKLSGADITVGDVTYPAARVGEAADALRMAGIEVTAENLVAILGMVQQ